MPAYTGAGAFSAYGAQTLTWGKAIEVNAGNTYSVFARLRSVMSMRDPIFNVGLELSNGTTIWAKSDQTIASTSWSEIQGNVLIPAGVTSAILKITQTDILASFEVDEFKAGDVTLALQMTAQVTAAAGHASTASTKATEAGQSANAAASSATAANTSAGNASTSAGQASTSATNAAGSASAASSSATTAATARDQASTARTDAQAAATAASSSATNAAASATSAGQEATTASTRANEAATSAGNAATSAGEAASSATDALGSKNAAATSATTAATSANNAGSSATAAANSATSATTKATEAATSATAANTAKTAAETARGQAQTAATAAATSQTNAADSATAAATSATTSATARNETVRTAGDLLPSTFDRDGLFWTHSLGGAPTSRGSLLSQVAFVSEAAEGRVAQVPSPQSANLHIATVGYVSAVVGRRYRLTVRARHVGAFEGDSANALRMNLRRVTSAYSSATDLISRNLTIAEPDVWQTFTMEASYTGTDPYLLPFAYVSGASFGGATGRFIQISFIRFEDITESKAAADSATASATSATNAAASATTAGQQATAATTAKTAAETARGQAQAAQTAAVTAKDAAESSATTAATQAGLAASSKTDAAGSATAASNSASTAETMASNASASATTAQTQAQTATTKAGEASTSATNAATSATNAAGSATAASSSATVASQASSAAGEYAKGNIVSKSNFEDGQAGDWAATVQNVPATHPLGRTKALRATTRDTNLGTLQNSSLTGLRRYRVTGYIYNQSDVSVAFGFQLQNTSGSYTWSVVTVDTRLPEGGTPAWKSFNVEMNATFTDVKAFRPFLQINGTNGVNTMLAFWTDIVVVDITESYNAAQSASAASTSASTAATKATEASTSATASSTARTAAETARGLAQTAATQAATSETNAAGSATSARNSVSLAALAMNAGISKNPVFEKWTGGGPDFISLAVSNGTAVKRLDGKYGNSVQINVTSNAGIGPYMVISDHSGSINPAKLLVTVELEILSGSTSGTSLGARWLKNGTWYYTDAQIGSKLSGNGIETYQIVLQRPAAALEATRCEIRFFSSHTNDGGTYGLCSLVVHRFDAQEIKADSYIDQQLSTKATLDGITQASYLMRVKAGGASAGFEMVAASNPTGPASSVRMSADEILLDGTVRAPQLSAGAITASKMAIGDLSNLYPDYDCADQNFYSSNGPTFTFVNTPAAAYGARDVGITADGELYSSWVSVDGGAELMVSGSTRNESAAANRTGTLYIEFGTLSGASGTVTPTRQVQVHTATNTTAATVATVNVSAGSNEDRFRFKLVRSGGTTGSTVRMGAMAVRRRTTGALLVNGAVTSSHVTTGELLTVSAQIRNAIINDGHIANLSAAKLTAGSALAATITVSGRALATINSDAATGAQDPASRINAAATKIDPGKITISGSTTLANWRGATDTTSINGGAIETNSITADSIQVGILPNMVTNGDLLMNKPAIAELWATNSGGSVSYSTAYLLRGNYTINMTKSALTNSHTISQTADNYMPVNSGDVMLAEIYARYGSGTAMTAGFYYRVHWYQKDRVTVSATPYTDVVTNGSLLASWRKYYKHLTVPSDAFFARVVIYNHSTNTVQQTIYLSGIRFTKTTGTVEIEDGAITADKLTVTSLSAISAEIGILRTKTSGERLEVRSDRILVFDSNGVVRVRIGDLG